eukprot:3794477-Prymnesium_polylepis.1
MNAFVRADKAACTREPARQEDAPNTQAAASRDVQTGPAQRVRKWITFDGRPALHKLITPVRCAEKRDTSPTPPVVA